MKTAQLRPLIRWIHLLGAAAIGTYVYSPWRGLAWFTLLMQFLIIPSLSLTVCGCGKAICCGLKR